MNCILCGGSTSVLFRSKTSVSVSSDCKLVDEFPTIFECKRCHHIQKRVTEDYKERVSALYSDYAAYSLTDGSEQLQFTADIPSTRTVSILHNCQSYLTNLKECIDWLDVGAGSGVMLRSVSDSFPQYNLWGQDISSKSEADIMKVPGVQGFFARAVNDIQRRLFDVISAIHVLEHVDEPHAFIRELKVLTGNKGVLLVQVPNIDENPMDLCIYDHVSHFSLGTLHQLLSEHFDHVFVPEQQVAKELTVLASNNETLAKLTNKSPISKQEHDFKYLEDLNDLLLNTYSPSAIFSTGPAGVYAAGCLSANLSGFVDEDPMKLGKTYLGVPVISPKSVPNSLPVIIPLPEAQRGRIMNRYNNINFVEL